VKDWLTEIKEVKFKINFFMPYICLIFIKIVKIKLNSNSNNLDFPVNILRAVAPEKSG
jgi:hypothetical protein